MDPNLTTAVIAAGSALLGALVGGLASVVAAMVNARAERRRELLRLSVQAAIADYEGRLEIAKRVGGSVPPLMRFLHLHSDVLQQLENGTLSADSITAAIKRARELNDATRDALSGDREPKPDGPAVATSEAAPAGSSSTGRRLTYMTLQLGALVLTAEAALFLARGNLTLTPTTIAQLSGTYFGHNPHLVPTLAKQSADTWVGVLMLFGGLLFQLAAFRRGPSWSDLGPARWLTLGITALLALLLFGAGHFASSTYAAHLAEQVSQVSADPATSESKTTPGGSFSSYTALQLAVLTLTLQAGIFTAWGNLGFASHKWPGQAARERAFALAGSLFMIFAYLMQMLAMWSGPTINDLGPTLGRVLLTSLWMSAVLFAATYWICERWARILQRRQMRTE